MMVRLTAAGRRLALAVFALTAFGAHDAGAADRGRHAPSTFIAQDVVPETTIIEAPAMVRRGRCTYRCPGGGQRTHVNRGKERYWFRAAAPVGTVHPPRNIVPTTPGTDRLRCHSTTCLAR